jgi:glycosyltransferase involved in cell wall biosynthesis
MRVLWVLNGTEIGGTRTMVLSLTGGLRERGWETPILFLGPGEFADECRSKGYDTKVLGLRAPPAPRGSLASKASRYVSLLAYGQRMRGRLDASVRAIQPDALHFLWPNHLPLVGAVAKRQGLPAYWEMPNIIGSGYPFDLNRRITAHQLKRYGVSVLAPSRLVARTFGPVAVPPVLLAFGVDHRRFDPDRVIPVSRTELRIPSDVVTLGIFARLDPSKGQVRMVDALGLLGDGEPEIHLCLFGDGQAAYLEQLEHRARTLPSRIRLRMFGAVPDPEKYYDVVDVAVNSRIDAEPFGLSTVEAMAMGRPVLVHALGGPQETVVDCATGWHTDDPTPEGFASALRRVLADRARWPEMGERARERVLQHYTLDRQVSRYQEILLHDSRN